MKELSFDQMENLNGARADCFYALGGMVLAAFGGPLAPVGVVVAIGSANGCGKTLDKTFGCLGSCSGMQAKNPNLTLPVPGSNKSYGEFSPTLNLDRY